MTQKECELLEIAEEVLLLNKDIRAKLTGGLMLEVRGIKKRREASDIDIICEYLCENGDGLPLVPKGFKLSVMDGSRSQVDAIQFINQDGIKIDFMLSCEHGEIIEGIPCGSVEELIKAKNAYVKNDISEISKEKHLLDIEFLIKQ